MGKTQNNSMVNVICFGSPAKQTFSYGLLLDVGGVVKGGQFPQEGRSSTGNNASPADE